MHLTARFKLHANAHDRRLLAIALRRWHEALRQAHRRAALRQRDLLRCIERRETQSGKVIFRVVRARLHALTVECCRGIETHLHSSASMSLIVALEEMLASWLGLYANWLTKERGGPQPGFLSLPARTR